MVERTVYQRAEQKAFLKAGSWDEMRAAMKGMKWAAQREPERAEW